MSDAIVAFSRDLQSDVEESLSIDTPFSQEVFTQLVLERLEDAEHLEGTFPLYQEGRVGKATYRIDGHAFDEERSRLDLFTTIYMGDHPPAKLSSAQVTRALDRALRFASASVKGLAAQLEPANTDASDLARLIEEKASELNAVRVILLTDGIIGDITPPSEWLGKPVQFEAYDIVRLYRVLGQGETRADIEVDLQALVGGPLPCLHVPAQNDDYDAYLAVLPGRVLSQIYEKYGVRLLELNVRAFLGIQGRKSVNAELRRTISDQPSMFLAYNNGIVATVDEIDVVPNGHGGAGIRFLRGLQIVNGGQTTASLHRAQRKDHLNLDHVGVPVKIIKVGGADLSDMVASISRAANRQNTVQLADFSANDPLHQQIETLANSTWLDDGKGRWFYERARGSYSAAEQKASHRTADQKSFRQQTPKQRRFGKLDVARYLSAWAGFPDKVCLGGQKNFQTFMQRRKDEPQPALEAGWFKQLVAITILYRTAEKKIRSMKFPAYGAQITAYVVSALSHRTGGSIDVARIWSKQYISLELEQVIAAWAIQLDGLLRKSAGQRNPSEWYKKADCWKEIQSQLPTINQPLPPELSPPDAITEIGAKRRTATDQDHISYCMLIPSAIWLEVADRGQKSGAIHTRDAGICRTLAEYAASGWKLKPTGGQAKPALEALLAVDKAGLLSRALNLGVPGQRAHT
jgi:hypothetical protein